MKRDEQILGLTKLQNKHKPVEFKNLFDIVSRMVDKQITPAHNIFTSVRKLWDSTLPAQLRDHCKIDGIVNGQLKVIADSPAYKYEFQLCCGQLLSYLQQNCPAARIKQIRVTIAGGRLKPYKDNGQRAEDDNRR